MKRVSFKVAKVIKDAGYPQECDEYYSVPPKYQDIGRKIAQPTYLEVWLWLWREKKSCIGTLFDNGDCAIEIWQNKSFIRDFESKFDPEEAITVAIEYLVDNNLII